ncbi:malonate transporter subunit MadL [Fibrella arboris]|uniref:malonate transporter subunit MadL n=1 Tax=Fibrella arboris TaxID=3242486 RepID=UPI003521D436
MLIRGVALLAGCYIVGQLIGESLGQLLNVNANIGGVGFAMLLLIFAQHWLEKRNHFHQDMEQGILFWSKLYIPVIVAMSATQNVRVALSSGGVAVLAGSIPVVLSLLFIPLLKPAKQPAETPEEWTI